MTSLITFTLARVRPFCQTRAVQERWVRGLRVHTSELILFFFTDDVKYCQSAVSTLVVSVKLLADASNMPSLGTTHIYRVF